MFNAYIPIFVLQYCLANSFGLFLFIYLIVVFCVLLFWPTHSYERDANLILFPDLLLTKLRFRQQEFRVRDYTKLYGNSKLEKSSHSQFFQSVVCEYIKCSTFPAALKFVLGRSFSIRTSSAGNSWLFLCIKIAVFLIFTLICFCFWF